MQADEAAAAAPPSILRRTLPRQLALVRALSSKAARVRPTDAATGGTEAACSPASEALLRRAHGYCVCAASMQAGRQVCSYDHERACHMRRRADSVRAAARVVALQQQQQQHATGGALLGPAQSSPLPPGPPRGRTQRAHPRASARRRAPAGAPRARRRTKTSRTPKGSIADGAAAAAGTDLHARCIASAVDIGSSISDAFSTSRPVRSHSIVL